MFSKLYSSVVIISFVEVVANAIAQSPLLTGWSWAALSLVALPILGMAYSAWRHNRLGFWPRLHGVAALIAMWVWPWLVLDGDALPAEFQPWIWWVIGMATISVGANAPIPIGTAYLVIATVAWFFIDTSYFAGNSDPLVSLQDSVYLFLVGGTISGLLVMVKRAARETDLANSALIQSSIEQAQTDAIERERQRIDALVHDHVLNTLVLASKAESRNDQESVFHFAKDSILILEKAAQEPEMQGSVTLLGLYRALRKAAITILPDVKVETHVAGMTSLPSSVAQAITEATLQALDNAKKHSRAKQVSLSLGVSDTDQILISIKDDGVGFRTERIGRDRIGIKTSIIARLNAVGARAEIDSSPGLGTTVTIRWSN